MMNGRSAAKSRPLLALAAFYVLLAVSGHGQIRFVQITDPHLYDEGALKKDKCGVERKAQEEAENLIAFRDCIDEINRRKIAGADYKFVVVTGDIGIEALVNLLRNKP